MTEKQKYERVTYPTAQGLVEDEDGTVREATRAELDAIDEAMRLHLEQSLMPM